MESATSSSTEDMSSEKEAEVSEAELKEAPHISSDDSSDEYATSDFLSSDALSTPSNTSSEDDETDIGATKKVKKKKHRIKGECENENRKRALESKEKRDKRKIVKAAARRAKKAKMYATSKPKKKTVNREKETSDSDIEMVYESKKVEKPVEVKDEKYDIEELADRIVGKMREEFFQEVSSDEEALDELMEESAPLQNEEMNEEVKENEEYPPRKKRKSNEPSTEESLAQITKLALKQLSKVYEKCEREKKPDWEGNYLMTRTLVTKARRQGELYRHRVKQMLQKNKPEPELHHTIYNTSPNRYSFKSYPDKALCIMMAWETGVYHSAEYIRTEQARSFLEKRRIQRLSGVLNEELYRKLQDETRSIVKKIVERKRKDKDRSDEITLNTNSSPIIGVEKTKYLKEILLEEKGRHLPNVYTSEETKSLDIKTKVKLTPLQKHKLGMINGDTMTKEVKTILDDIYQNSSDRFMLKMFGYMGRIIFLEFLWSLPPYILNSKFCLAGEYNKYISSHYTLVDHMTGNEAVGERRVNKKKTLPLFSMVCGGSHFQHKFLLQPVLALFIQKGVFPMCSCTIVPFPNNIVSSRGGETNDEVFHM